MVNLYMHTCYFRISDALVAANDHLNFPGKDGDKTMYEAIHDMDAYINLTDSVVDRILQFSPTPSDGGLKEVMMRVHNVVCFSAKYFYMPSLCLFTLLQFTDSLRKFSKGCRRDSCTSVLWMSPVISGKESR